MPTLKRKGDIKMAINNTTVTGECFHFDYGFWDNPLRFNNIYLWQIGEVCSESGYAMQRHVQECNEISLIISGSGQAYLDGELIQLKEGDIFICSTGHTHQMIADSFNTMRFLYMGFTFVPGARTALRDIVDFYENKPYTLVKDDHTVLHPFAKALDEFYVDRACSQLMIEDYCEQVIVLAYRMTQQIKDDIIQFPRGESPTGAIVYSAIRYIDKNIFDVRNVADLAAKLGYSHSYISHIFKERTGMTLQRYIIMKRHEKALELLRMGTLNVTEVAQKLNYKTIQAFTKSFTRTMGFPPSHYDKIMREEAEDDGAWEGVV